MASLHLSSAEATNDNLRCAQVLSVSGGVCKVQFGGPPPIGMGVQAAIKDKFTDIKTVELVD